jgi:hypothetical protein
MHVKLSRSRPGPFRRSVRSEDGKSVLRVLEFQPGEAVELTDPLDLAAVRKDLGHALEVLPELPLKPVAADPEEPTEPNSGESAEASETSGDGKAAGKKKPKLNGQNAG